MQARGTKSPYLLIFSLLGAACECRHLGAAVFCGLNSEGFLLRVRIRGYSWDTQRVVE